MNLYHLVSTARGKTYLTRKPMTKAECETMFSKLSSRTQATTTIELCRDPETITHYRQAMINSQPVGSKVPCYGYDV